MDTPNFQQLKVDLHRTLLSKMDLEKLSTIHNGKAVQTVSLLIQDIMAKEKVPLSAIEKDKLQTDLIDEIFGLGPLEPLLKDHTISDILVNNRNLVYIEEEEAREGQRKISRRQPFTDYRSHRGQSRAEMDESSPMVVRLLDGSRVTLSHSSLALDGPALSYGVSDLPLPPRLLESRSISAEMRK
jgi:pilus assembly protein CpaF